ncbi:hypothetical protein NS220_06755 [Microbacterium testaceum]|uniref:Uncharacterized protein n=1 Tax=Microbacterium testaceum TaxID=2033 RepID=A0A147EYC0_MICTE|nr:hypothetical protein NS220_06755 [Microbacterium testaceum]
MVLFDPPMTLTRARGWPDDDRYRRYFTAESAFGQDTVTPERFAYVSDGVGLVKLMGWSSRAEKSKTLNASRWILRTADEEEFWSGVHSILRV